MSLQEWTIDAEAEAGEITEDDLERFAVALESDPRVLGSASSLNTATRALGASFGVVASDAAVAADIARDAFRSAHAEAGLPGEPVLVKLAVER